MTRRCRALLIALCLCPPVLSAAEPADWPEWVGKSRDLTTQLGTELKGELTRAIEQRGRGQRQGDQDGAGRAVHGSAPSGEDV